MRHIILPLLLLLFVVLEGVALDILPSSLIDGNLMITPHWVLMFLILITIFYDDNNSIHSIIYALIFGLLIDIAYTGILGVYMFTYGLVIYVIHGMKKLLHSNIYSTLLFGIISIIIAELIINLIYFVIGVMNSEWLDYLMVRLIPSILANSIFLALIYPLFTKKLEKWKSYRVN
ncbi:rod shape-determining protein MreD [Ornithinibacillus halotolerans]|uniref:Rod shape-determining protein MreD n=1 Tax=Ornithinibacillus halotolerans TaxID=1274357 RepID=A0A916S624_9BACI|nr:rod shape-determining protein MreD [Ornithinibacillus halotolerans]GGA85918.1 rod shape-determining protein MreD [Ornithinibacillus halotolerans]